MARNLKRDSESFFDYEAQRYNSAGSYEMVKEDYPDILAELERESCTDVLDCGCGTGSVLALLHNAHPELTLTGLDFSAKMIELAQGRKLEGVTFVMGDAENLAFDDASFDAIICSHSFHHYPHPQDFFNGVARILRAQGRLIIRDNTGPWWWLFGRNCFKLPYMRRVVHSGDVHFYSRREVARLCRHAGLVMELFEERGKHKMHCVARKP